MHIKWKKISPCSRSNLPNNCDLTVSYKFTTVLTNLRCDIYEEDILLLIDLHKLNSLLSGYLNIMVMH